MLIGWPIYLRRDLILRDLPFAQFVLGAGASAVVPALTLLLLLSGGKELLLGWGTLWQWIVMTAVGAVATPFIFSLMDSCNRALGYQDGSKPVSASTAKSSAEDMAKEEICATPIKCCVFDELKKNEPQLRLVAVMLVAGLVHFAGRPLVGAGRLVARISGAFETQAYRTIRLPAVRGKILDREGRVLAENQPRYNLSLYLDDLHQPFDAAYGEFLKSARAAQKQNIANAEKNWTAR